MICLYWDGAPESISVKVVVHHRYRTSLCGGMILSCLHDMISYISNMVSSSWNGPHVCYQYFNTLRPRQNGRHFPDDIFKCIFLNENVWISIKISLKLVPKGPINNIPALVQIMAWRRPGDKPLSEPMMIGLLMHICVTRSQWVKTPNMSWHLNNPSV